ncbi:MAG: helix-hairpin-helix domain-containing protein [Bacteroidota bacterium]
MKKIIKEAKDLFSFSAGERRGVIILMALILLLILFYFIYPVFLTPTKYDTTAFDREVDSFLKNRKTIAKENDSASDKFEFDILDQRNPEKQTTLHPFPFDPNSMTHAQWLQMGLTEKQVKVIENYVAKGGKFYDKADFKKMYCISAEAYTLLEPYINITLSRPQYPKNEFPKKEVVITQTEINSATIEDLKKIRGIGDYFATKIVEYRQKLGGYISLQQLLEIPKMDTARLRPLLPFFDINTKAIRKINVNQAHEYELGAHPYIGNNIASAIIRYRLKHGNFALLSDIKKCMLVTDAIYVKISPYLCVE